MGRKKKSKSIQQTPSQSDISFTECYFEEDEEERLVMINKKLDDFDMQVHNIKRQMDDELTSLINEVNKLYATDHATTPPEINNMTLYEILYKNATKPKPEDRMSIAVLVEEKTTRKQPRRAAKTPQIKVMGPPATTHTTRGKKVLGVSQTSNLPPPSTVKPLRGKRINELQTPMNPFMMPMSNFLVTPKFDPRGPMPPPETMRKPKPGEIAISLTGSPLQLGSKEWLEGLKAENIDEKTREELAVFHNKISNLLQIEYK